MSATDVDSYLAKLPADQASALQQLRREISAYLPNHIECISYAMPGFRQPGPKGKMVIGYAAFAHHLGLYPHSGNIIPTLAADCAGFKTSKSGVLFTPTHPIPTSLLHKIIDARGAELAAKGHQ